MKTKIRWLHPFLDDFPIVEGEVELAAEPSIDELHAILDPLLGTSHFEHVRVYVGDEPWLGPSAYRDMFVDEDGLARGLERNEAATELYLRNWRMHNPAPHPAWAMDQAAIVGPAVFFPERIVWR